MTGASLWIFHGTPLHPRHGPYSRPMRRGRLARLLIHDFFHPANRVTDQGVHGSQSKFCWIWRHRALTAPAVIRNHRAISSLLLPLPSEAKITGSASVNLSSEPACREACFTSGTAGGRPNETFGERLLSGPANQARSVMSATAWPWRFLRWPIATGWASCAPWVPGTPCRTPA